MNKWVGIVTAAATAITAVITMFSQQISDYATSNPVVSAMLAAVAVIVAALSKSATGSDQK